MKKIKNAFNTISANLMGVLVVFSALDLVVRDPTILIPALIGACMVYLFDNKGEQ